MERKMKVRITPMLLSILMVLSLILSMTPSVSASSTRYTRKFNQWSYEDSDYELYEAGCGLFATGNAIYALTGQTIDIAALKKWAKSIGGWTASSGLYPTTYFPKLAKSEFVEEYNFTVSERFVGGITDSNNAIATNVSRGNVAAVIGVPNHYMVITDYNAETDEYFVIESAVSGSSYRNLPAASWVSESKLSTGKTKVRSYIFFTFEDVDPIVYTDVPAGTYYFKNKSTGTYMSVDSAAAANGQNVSVAAKKETAAFQFKITGGLEHYFYSMLNTGYVVNPYSDTPSSGTNVTLYKKDNSGTQIWKFVAVSGGYAIHLKYNPNCVLTANGTNVQLAAYTGAANQIWTLEDAAAAPEPEPAALSSIAINPDSVGTIYEDGSQMDTSGLIITATYSDGTTASVTSGYSLTRPSLSTAGTKALTVTYEGMTATLDITVQDLFEGDGTESDPYLIGTDEDLKNLADMVNNTAANSCYGTAYYKQTADIDLGLYDWIPIGCYYVDSVSTTTTSKAGFNGTYDGNYHTVTGLKVSVNRSYAGLFGRGDGNAEITNLAVEGTVKAADNYAGGIIGALCWGAKVSGCSFTGTVSAPYNVGGITGIVHQGGYIESCYANAEITATDTTWGYAGGIAGYTRTGGSNESCTAVGVSNCYFVGKTDGSALENGITCGVEQLEGTYQPTLTISNCYYLNSATTGAAQSGCMGLISSQLKTIATDLGSPFADNPDSTLNDGYPVFEWQLTNVTYGDANDDGTVNVLDVIVLNKNLLSGAALSAQGLRNADVDGDSVPTAADSLLILKYIVHLVEALPV